MREFLDSHRVIIFFRSTILLYIFEGNVLSPFDGDFHRTVYSSTNLKSRNPYNSLKRWRLVKADGDEDRAWISQSRAFDTVGIVETTLGLTRPMLPRGSPRGGVAIGGCQVFRLGGLPVVIIPLREHLYGRGREWFSNSALNLFLFFRRPRRGPGPKTGVNMLIHGI